jgi:hypothetical protein
MKNLVHERRVFERRKPNSGSATSNSTSFSQILSTAYTHLTHDIPGRPFSRKDNTTAATHHNNT